MMGEILGGDPDQERGLRDSAPEEVISGLRLEE